MLNFVAQFLLPFENFPHKIVRKNTMQNPYLFQAIYVINLDKDVDRLKAVKQQVQQFRTPVIRIPAIDASTMDEQTLESFSSKLCSVFCTKEIIACAASHITAWKQFLQSPYGVALFCEDDVEFEPNITSRLPSLLKQVPSDFDLVWIGCNDCQYDENDYTWSANFIHSLLSLTTDTTKNNTIISENVYIPKIALGAHCYMLSRKGAEKLLQRVSVTYFHLDTMLTNQIQEMKMYALHPKLAKQKCLLSMSNIATGKYPQLPNTIADKIVNSDNTSLGYILSVPAGRIGILRLNFWCAISFILGALSSYLWKKDGSTLPFVVFGTLFVAPDLLLFPVKEQVILDMTSFILCYIAGFTVARLRPLFTPRGSSHVF